MAITYKDVFSEYEIKESSIKIEGEGTFEKIGCVGSIEETLETITVTKKCEGLVVKSVTRGSGNGEVKLSLHMRYDLYTKMFGMEDETLADGVLGYGQNSRHKNFAFVAKVKDEDANVKYIAYPKLIIQSGISKVTFLHLYDREVEGIKLMIETGIEVEQLILNKGEINGKKIYRNSEKN